MQIYVADFMLLPPQQNVKQISDFMSYLAMKKCRLSQDTVVQVTQKPAPAMAVLISIFQMVVGLEIL